MIFSVVLSIDAPAGVRLPGIRRSLARALRGSCDFDSDYRYLAKEGGGRAWAKARSWQGSGLLSRQQFEALVDDLGAQANDTETLGTLGGPLAPWGGIVSDIDFSTDDEERIVTLRVTPVSRLIRNLTAQRWDRLRAAMIRQYADGSGSHFLRISLDARRRWQERFPRYGTTYAAACRRAAFDSKEGLA